MSAQLDQLSLYLLAGSLLILVGLYGLAMREHVLQKLLAINVVGVGVFMLFLTFAARFSPADPVPQALVLTGIVVAISATAVGLALLRYLYRLNGQTQLDREPEREH